jgi:hypothetical protein
MRRGWRRKSGLPDFSTDLVPQVGKTQLVVTSPVTTGKSMPLQDRITPFGEFIATPARGTLMGNRGGRLHDEARRLGARRWVSKQWICCKLDFNNRHRDVWGDGYSELFFLDEVTAFAAGHRPCFECRRHEAERFAALFSGKRQRAGAAQMDRVLHAERLDGKAKRLHTRALDTLPNGAMIARDGGGFAVRGTHLLRWTPSGYADAHPRPRGIVVDVLTPPSILAVLARGYAPLWHQSAG